MSFRGDEEQLAAAASRALGGERILAAAVFGWQDLVLGQIAGMTAGGAVGDLVSGGSSLAGGIGAVLGGRAGIEAMAVAHGLTPALLVSVTETDIHVHNLPDEHVGDEVLRFPRATSNVSVSRFGLSRVLVLEDPDAGTHIALHGSTSPLAAQAKPDKVVLHLLAAPS